MVSKNQLLRDIVAKHLAQTVYSQELLVKLTNELIRFAEQAYVMRDVDALDDVSRILMNLPVDAARQVGLYYCALAINRKGHRAEAERLLERVADNAPFDYRARAIQTLGTNQYDKGELDEALRFQLEALRAVSGKNANALQTTLLAHLAISVINSVNGDHKKALSSLESLSPLVNLSAKQKPFYLHAYCNELAIELGELGRLSEAEAACKIALAYPFASAYPEWTETRLELEAKRTSATPSVVAINRPPEAEPSTQPEPQRKPHRSKPRILKLAVETTFLQRASKTIAIMAAISIDRTTQSILDRMLICIGPRAPPALS